MSFLRNVWYMAGWSAEIEGEALFTRRLLGVPVLIYRQKDGTPIALRDRCPHRFAPLSRGVRKGDTIVCGYHGLQFDANGACVYNPYSDRIPARATVQSFPLIERDGILWLWPGDASRADPAAVPELAFLPDTPASRTVHGYTLMKANYQYGTDNLMDLSHIEFVHRGSFAGAGVIFAGRHESFEDGITIHSNWWMPDIPTPSMAAHAYPPDTRMDHWLEMRWNAPACMRLMVGATPAGAPREQGLQVPQAHVLTPADERTTHYFWATTRYDNLASEFDAPLQALFQQAFDTEDKPMIEAAYANVVGDFWAEQPVGLPVDSGGVRARRMLERLIAAEQASA